MERAPRQRSSSISRRILAHDFRNSFPPEFTPHQARQLAFALKVLDKSLHSAPVEEHQELNFDSILQIAESGDPQDAGHDPLDDDVAKALHSYICAQKIWRRETILPAFLKGYLACLAGRPYTNDYTIIDFRKGRACTCSEALRVLPEMERLLGTNLCAQFDAVHARVKPFPFLNLPAELRLQVYSYLLPRAPYISVLDQPSANWAPLQLNLNLLRVCHQIHTEAAKQFYENRCLFVKVVRGQGFEGLDNYVMTRIHEIIAVMNPQIRLLFKRMEIQVDFLPMKASTANRYPEVKAPDDPFQAMLALLPNIETFLISFPWRGSRSVNNRPDASRVKAAEFLVDSIPTDKEILWDFTFWGDETGERIVTEKMQDRGGLHFRSSILQEYRLGLLSP